MAHKTGLEEYYSIKNNQKMRFGYTTGACAAGAAKAASRMLLEDSRIFQETLMTPKGILLNLEILHTTSGNNWVSCAVKKDAGDDPDITDQLEIFAKVEKSTQPGIWIQGGEGVGIVTRKGLEQPIGSPAINKVPQAMIRKELEALCQKQNYPGGLVVTISVPKGQEIARKTFNPRLGIQGEFLYWEPPEL